VPKYELIEPFEADDDSLAGLTPEQCFVLGVEWAMFRSKLLERTPFKEVVIADNAVRLASMAERHNRFVEVKPIGEGWAELDVSRYFV
jgi:hypothetical protein